MLEQLQIVNPIQFLEVSPKTCHTKVTLYWIWPKYFRNYIYGSRNTYGDLFTDVSDKNADYTELLKLVNNSSNKDKLFYGAKDSDDPSCIKADMKILYLIHGAAIMI